MRITFVTPYAALNGGNRVIATYALELLAQGHDVQVVSAPKVRQPLKQRVKLRLLGRGDEIKSVKPVHPLFHELGARHRVTRTAAPVTADDVPDADVVVATFWRTAPAVAALPPAKGRKFYLLQDYETFIDHRPGEKVADTYDLPLSKIAVSGYIRDQLATHHGVQGIPVIPNAVDLDQFDAPARRRNTPLKVGFLYNTHPRKRVELTIEALQLARARVPGLQVLAFGAERPGEGRVPLPGWVDYRLTPAQSDLAGLYASCDLWLFTTRTEGFGLPLLEAMACRTPVLATRAGAAGDLITGKNGKLMEPDAAAFADEIAGFAAMDEAGWAAYSQAAHDTARGYSWADATRRLVQIFEAS
jgi:glycosyltransferase involved in cell wall biosynthesis